MTKHKLVRNIKNWRKRVKSYIKSNTYHKILNWFTVRISSWMICRNKWILVEKNYHFKEILFCIVITVIIKSLIVCGLHASQCSCLLVHLAVHTMYTYIQIINVRIFLINYNCTLQCQGLQQKSNTKCHLRYTASFINKAFALNINKDKG